MTLTKATTLALALALATAGCAATQDQAAPTASGDHVVAALTEALAGPEGEYAAAASYEAVLTQFGQVEPYVSIHQQELRHIQALTRQLQRLGAKVPEDRWTGRVQAPEGLRAAASAWADGEVANVAMYDRLLGKVGTDPMVTRVLGNLHRASQECHLPLFEAAASADGTLSRAQITPCQVGRGYPPSASRTGTNFAIASANSSSGSESATIPHPANSRTVSPVSCPARNAIPNSPSPEASIQPTGAA